jgi:hypothetical protein
MTNAFLPETVHESEPNTYNRTILDAYDQYDRDTHDAVMILPDDSAYILFDHGSGKVAVLSTELNHNFQIIPSTDDTLKVFSNSETAFRFLRKVYSL